ncbi:MAG TPA: hypothetical protein VFU86_12330, partial [Terriglobales bacterium]|nr:hypothetical protein [Terriglobales bacterium]
MNVQRFLRNYLPGYSVLLALAGLTVATLVIHGYHVGVEDQAIYLPSILRALHPALFPHDAVLFEAQTSHTVITPAIVAIVRDGHLSLEWSLLLVHLFAIFLLLVGAWRVAHRCFGPSHSVWAGLAFLTALFLIPIAGTSQYIVDQYMHPRALSTALILLPVADFLPGEPRRRRPFAYAFAALCFALSFVLQLQMAVFGLGLLLFLAIPWERWMLV